MNYFSTVTSQMLRDNPRRKAKKSHQRTFHRQRHPKLEALKVDRGQHSLREDKNHPFPHLQQQPQA